MLAGSDTLVKLEATLKAEAEMEAKIKVCTFHWYSCICVPSQVLCCDQAAMDAALKAEEKSAAEAKAKAERTRYVCCGSDCLSGCARAFCVCSCDLESVLCSRSAYSFLCHCGT